MIIDDSPAPQRIGRYEIKAEIGRGGMATVYRAYDPLSKREVAVKVLPRELLHNPTFRARFQREAEVIAGLEHPAIVPVYDFGEEDGQPYFVMRLMTGGSLADRLRQGPLSLEEVVRIFHRISPAVDRAHAKDIIHRDLKPDNILFDDEGNPYISDFGIAKLAQSNVSMTGSGVVGTPAYMSPEQARGEEKIDGRSDIYSLGAIIFQTLTGAFPYKADTPMGVVVKHITDPVPLIRNVKPDLPSECEDVIQQAMAKNRDERFQSASEMAAALVALVGDKTFQTHASSTVRLTSRIQPAQTASLPAIQPAQKGGHGKIIGGLIAIIIVIAASVGLLVVRSNSAAQPTATAQAVALAGSATRAAQTTATDAALLSAAASATAQQLSLQVTVASSTPAPTATATVTPTNTPTDTATPTPAPTQFGGGTGRIVFVSKRDGNNEIYVMNADGAEQTRLTDNQANDSFPVWSPDGRQIVFFSNRDGNNEIYLMDANGSSQTRLTNNTESDYNPAWSPDGKRIVFVSSREGSNRIYVMNANGSGETLLTDSPAGHESPSWSPDGTKIAFSTNRDGNYEIYVMEADGSSPVRITNHSAEDTFPAWSPDGKRILFTSNRDGNSELYTIGADGFSLTRLTNHRAEDSFPAWSPDGTKIAFTSFRDGNLEIYVMNADGSGVSRLTDNPAIDFAPSWQPPEPMPRP